jgi:hypothetical protein
MAISLEYEENGVACSSCRDALQSAVGYFGARGFFLVLFWTCLAMVPAACRAADLAEELAEASHSPEAVQGFIAAHSTFSLAPLWRSLGMPPTVVFPDCEEVWAWQMCSAELLTVSDPPQTIVLVRREDANVEMYLRYLRRPPSSTSGAWRFSGYLESAAKYFPLRHRIVMFAGTPFLAIAAQGVSGTGVSSEYERWVDLRGQDFKPAFSYTVEAQYSATVEGSVSRHFRGAVTTLKKSPSESITVTYHTDFTYQPEGQRALTLGTRQDTAVFVRQRGADFVLAPALSSVSATELNELYGAQGDAFSCDDLVKYDFKSLREMLAGTANSDPRRPWLREYLDNWCTDTPDTREIKGLLR